MPPLVPLLAYKNLCTQDKCLEQLLWRGMCKWCQHKPSYGRRSGKLSLGAQEGNVSASKAKWRGAASCGNQRQAGQLSQEQSLPCDGCWCSIRREWRCSSIPLKTSDGRVLPPWGHRDCTPLVWRTFRLIVLGCLLVRHVLCHLISVCVYDSSLEVFVFFPFPNTGTCQWDRLWI